jgi:hypothetical protein
MVPARVAELAACLDRPYAAVTWFDAIRAWQHWERVWHGIHVDPAGVGVVDVAEGLLWVGPGGGDAHRRLRDMDVPDIRDGDLVVGHLNDRRRGGASFAGGRWDHGDLRRSSRRLTGERIGCGIAGW